MEKESSLHLLLQYVHDPNLIKHCLATGAIMKATALKLGEDPSSWEMIGILHDIDFEVTRGDMQRHGIEGATILLEHGIDQEYTETVKRHNHLLFCDPYTHPVDIALQAADSVSGLIIACALVKGGRLSDVKPKTITKKARDKSFAAGCNRGRITLIAQLMDIADFYAIAIDGLLGIKDELDLK
jgi:uncharacterized protein